jgi:galacturan 1,4-alpha-galacturonidase
MPVGYQNQSTVWFLGGEGLTVDGFGVGTLDGNGQTWYDLVKGVSNYPRECNSNCLQTGEPLVLTNVKIVQWD